RHDHPRRGLRQGRYPVHADGAGHLHRIRIPHGPRHPAEAAADHRTLCGCGHLDREPEPAEDPDLDDGLGRVGTQWGRWWAEAGRGTERTMTMASVAEAREKARERPNSSTAGCAAEAVTEVRL